MIPHTFALQYWKASGHSASYQTKWNWIVTSPQYFNRINGINKDLYQSLMHMMHVTHFWHWSIFVIGDYQVVTCLPSLTVAAAAVEAMIMIHHLVHILLNSSLSNRGSSVAVGQTAHGLRVWISRLFRCGKLIEELSDVNQERGNHPGVGEGSHLGW